MIIIKEINKNTFLIEKKCYENPPIFFNPILKKDLNNLINLVRCHIINISNNLYFHRNSLTYLRLVLDEINIKYKIIWKIRRRKYNAFIFGKKLVYF